MEVRSKGRSMNIKRALLSVWDKKGIVDLARELNKRNIEILASGGTYKALLDSGVEAIELAEYTRCPEILGGRVKTLHPLIHGGILRKRDAPCSTETEESLKDIDLVVVNLYPFMEKALEGLQGDKLIEYIDVGGPSLLRAASKNFKWVVVLSSPEQYEGFINSLDNDGPTLDERRVYAARAFQTTTEYDLFLASYLSGIEDLSLIPNLGGFAFKLKYGENPFQNAVLYKHQRENFKIDQIAGPELGYNNYLDIDSALMLLSEFSEPACVIVKHGNPCGVGICLEDTPDALIQAFSKARETDPLAWFGGILAINREFSSDLVNEIKGKFLEVILAPTYNKEGLERLTKRSNRRVLKYYPSSIKPYQGLRSTGFGFLVQNPNITEPLKWEVVTQLHPSDEQDEALRFAWRVVAHTKSNAVVIATRSRTLGIGAGQMSRIDSTKIAIGKYKGMQVVSEQPVLASDGFFPFPDSIEAAYNAGISSVIQPGGSKGDDEVIKAADALGMSMVFTGIRVFRH